MSAVPELRPRLEGELRAVLADPGLPHAVVDALGSPVNLVLPGRLAENLNGFRDVYRSHRLTGTVYFAHKANRSRALVRALAAADAGIDVASLGELENALAAGFGPERIMATGPKSREFLWLAARTGVIVNADSVGELTTLAGIVEAFGLPRVRVMARLSGFAGATVLTRTSRFGVAVDSLAPLWECLARHRDALDLLGVAFHLDTVGLPEKAVAMQGCLHAMDEAHRHGLDPRAIDAGGGFGVSYLDDGGQWEEWTTALTGAVLGERPPLTWNGHGYGLRNDGGTVRGALSVYPAFRPVTGPAYLDRLLGTESAEHRRTLGTLLLDSLYDLHVEPGRALLDQCGAVLMRVEEVRGDLVRLAGNGADAALEQHGVLMDPVLIPRGDPGPARRTEVHLAGNLCLEADLITRRRVPLPHRPRPGDLLAFVNTAGYLMDFSASAALMQPSARTVAVFPGATGPRWCLDDQYWPVTGLEETG